MMPLGQRNPWNYAPAVSSSGNLANRSIRLMPVRCAFPGALIRISPKRKVAPPSIGDATFLQQEDPSDQQSRSEAPQPANASSSRLVSIIASGLGRFSIPVRARTSHMVLAMRSKSIWKRPFSSVRSLVISGT